jgi:hypothetical protein
MKKIILTVLFTFTTLVSAEPASTTPKKEGLSDWFNVTTEGPIAYPGYMWANAVSPSNLQPGAPKGNIGYSAKVEQGIDWFAFDQDKKIRLNTFVNAVYARDTSDFAYTYGNVFTPAVGVKVRNVYESGLIEVGVQYANQTNLNVAGSSGGGVQAFINVWTGWDLKK